MTSDAPNGPAGHVFLACPKCGAAYKVRKERMDEALVCLRCGQEWVPSQATKSAEVAKAAGKPPEAAAPRAQPAEEAEPEAPPVAPALVRAVEEEVDPLVGTTIDNFKIASRIGSGGFGVVYRAFDTELERSVALKMLPPNVAKAGETVLERFLREARSAAKLSHANIVTIHQIRRYRDTFYLVMELVDGSALHEVLARQPRLKPSEARRIVRDAAQGLAHAHKRGVIHRDIKPGNILLTADGQVKVSDFGLARDVLQASDIVGEGHSLGTPRYMSPEQAMGEQPTAASDLYSLAATYFVLLTGHSPYDASGDREMMKKHVSAPVPDPRRWVPDLPVTVFRFFEKAMAKDPDERYQTAEEFIAALDRLDFSQQLDEAAPTAQSVSAQIGPITFEDRGSHLSKALGRAVRRAQRHSVAISPRQAAQAAAKGARLGGWKLWLLVGVGAALVIGGAIVAALLLAPEPPTGGGSPAPQGSAPGPEGAAPATPEGVPAGAAPAPPARPKPEERPAVPPNVLEANAQMQLEDAKLFEQKAAGDPFRRVDVLRAYQDVVDFYPGTQAAQEARQAIERLRKEEAPEPPAAPETPAPAEGAPAEPPAKDEASPAPKPADKAK